MTPPSVSIVVTNYNYARFLREAIDSALAQTHPRVEVVVVDDGSTDGSPAMIRSYGDRIIPLLKQNGGQASSFNAGFGACSGEAVVFVDADDVLLPAAAAAAAAAMARSDAVKVHWPLWDIDEHGRRLGSATPQKPLPSGELQERQLREGPDSYVTPPTTGNLWSRRFLERVLPVPERPYRTCADSYLFALAPLFGPVAVVPEPMGLYRRHGTGNYEGLSFLGKIVRDRAVFEANYVALLDWCERLGIDADRSGWEDRRTWLDWVYRSSLELRDAVPAGESVILIDGDQWGVETEIAGIKKVPLPERNGRWFGFPSDGPEAVEELERLHRRGIRYAAVAWPAFWWLDYYGELRDRLVSGAQCILENERVLVFDLDAAP